MVDINTHSDLFGARTLAVQCYTEQVNENVNQRSSYRLSLLDSFAKIVGHSLDSIKEFMLVARNDKNRTLVDRLKEMLYEVLCLKSNEDMILALAGQFKQLSHEPEKFRWLNGIRTHDLCDAGAVL